MSVPESVHAHRRAAGAVDDAANARSRAASAAQAGWHGPAREAFDRDLAGIQREAAALVEELLAAAAALEQAWDEVQESRGGLGPR